MVNYWLCVTNEENWRVVKERKIWGVPREDYDLIFNVIT